MRTLKESKAWPVVAERAKKWGYGLCLTISLARDIRPGTKDRMMTRIKTLARRRLRMEPLANSGGVEMYMLTNFLWPITDVGYRARTAWAKRQATAAAKLGR